MNEGILITFFFFLFAIYCAYCILFNYDDKMSEYVTNRNKLALLFFSFFSVISILYLIFYVSIVVDLRVDTEAKEKEYSNAVISQLFIILLATFFMAPSIAYHNSAENWLSKSIYVVISMIAAAACVALLVFTAEHLDTINKDQDPDTHGQTVVAVISSFFLMLDYFVYNFIYETFRLAWASL